jgi:hypothetical protein
MPASYRIDVRAGVVFSVFEGHVTNEELLAHQQRMSADPHFRSMMNHVIDARNIREVAVTAFGIRLVAAPSIFAPGSRRAIIGGDASSSSSACSRPCAVRAARTSESSRRSRTHTAGSGWTRTTMRKSGSQKGKSPSRMIDEKIKELGDWRGKMLSQLRTLIRQADPDVVEEWKWRGVPVWSHDGLICTGETYKNVVKMTFSKGAALEDPSGLFNSSLDGNTRRAIDFHEGEKIDEKALKALIRAAVTLNASRAQSR